MSVLDDWTAAVCAELGLDDVDRTVVVPQVLDLARDVAHGVARPAAPLTTYLVGLAAGLAAGRPGADPAALFARVRELAGAWGADTG